MLTTTIRPQQLLQRVLNIMSKEQAQTFYWILITFDTDPIETSVLALYIPPTKEHTLILDEH